MTDLVDLAVVGAGPAGLEAAITAAEAGLSVTVIDAYPQSGGQYFKQLASSFQNDKRTARQKQAETLFRRLQGTSIRMLANTTVWGVFPAADGDNWLLALDGLIAPVNLQARALVLATGAYDRPIGFPGWTLPGVMTAGAVQSMLKTQRILPGQRLLLSGTGPLQLSLANQLIQAGATVVAVLDGAAVALVTFRHAARVWGQWERLGEGLNYWRALRRAKVPFRVGWSVIEAKGNAHVEQAIVAQLDKSWKPIPSTRETMEVDAVVIGYGFLPATDLSRVLLCDQDFKPALGGFVPQRNDEMQTSVPGVYAVGDCAGIGGAELARIEGRIAGIAVARRLGKSTEQQSSRSFARFRSARARELKFGQMLGDVFTPGAGLYGLATDDTVICRCEEITLGEIRQALSDGARNVTEVKGLTRVGMGNCQGRMCCDLVAHAFAEFHSKGSDYTEKLESAGTLSVRPPIHPLPMSVIAKGAEIQGRS